ncbi:hypothetical protein LTR85_006361 [Meristemomyces frigidus]|nr:hypothetical protein LTR85_006361 [Meristemomyces frigidus]
MPAFLTLPRELRDQIYDNVTKTVMVSDKDLRDNEAQSYGRGWDPKVELSQAAYPALLLVNKQVHDEYTERRSSGSCLHFNLRGCDIFAPEKPRWKQGVPLSLLRSIKVCTIRFSWLSLGALTNDRRTRQFEAWHRTASPAEVDQQASLLQWTPTKEIYDALQRFFTILRPFVHDSAKVELQIELVSLLENALYHESGSVPPAHCMGERDVHRLQRLLHTPTLTELATNPERTWPLFGKLDIGYFVVTPLFYAMARNSEQLRTTGGDGSVFPIAERSQQAVVWRLVLVGDGPHWRGYSAELYKILELVD